MKTWTETLTLAALAAVLTLVACGQGDVANVNPDVDEEAVAKVQADVEGWIIAGVGIARPSSGLPDPPMTQRGVDPDLDEQSIREYAQGNDPSEGEWHNPIPLNEAEIELLLERLRAKKESGK